MNIENTNIERESTERPEDEWIERFSSWLVGGLLYRFLPGELGKKVNAVISAVIGYDLKRLISSPPKKFNNLLYDLFYEKQSNEYWNVTREEMYRKILRQTELFGINAKLSNLDINTYLQQWIKDHSKEAMEIPGMIETALAHSQRLLGEAKGGDIIDFYKNQVMSLLNWKEIYSRAYASIADQRRNQEITSNIAGSDARQKQIESTKTNVINAPINVTSLPYSISDLNLNDSDFEKGYSLPSGGSGTGEFSFSLLPENYGMADDIMSSFNLPVDVSAILEENYAYNLPEASLSSSGGSAGTGFTMREGISIPLQYEIEVKGLEQFESIKEKTEEVGEAVEESRDTVSNFSSEMMKQFLKLDEEKRAALSVDMAMLPLNIMGIGGAPFQFSTPVEESKQFSETLSDIAGIAGQLGGAFMNVDESIGRAIGSAGGLAGGISNVLSALKMNPLEGVDTSKMTPEQIEAAKEQGEKQKGLALMGGIQGAFAGLQGLFGGEAGSDIYRQ